MNSADDAILNSAMASFQRPECLWDLNTLRERDAKNWDNAGVYGWWFNQSLGDFQFPGCKTHNGYQLLYLGIGPVSPTSGSSHRKRLVSNHISGTARNSTLRLSLGSLLRQQLGIRLSPYGGKFNFGAGEEVLSDWMSKHARVSIFPIARPWELEKALIQRLILPLNLDDNSTNTFAEKLREVRASARREGI